MHHVSQSGIQMKHFSLIPQASSLWLTCQKTQNDFQDWQTGGSGTCYYIKKKKKEISFSKYLTLESFLEIS